MAGVSEASAIIGLVGTAAQLSRVIIEIGSKYKHAKAQIESFGRELGILSKILDQLRRLLSKDASSLDMSFHVLTTEIIDECGDLFSQLNVYKEKLYSTPTSQNPSWRGKTKWVFEAAELDYLRARVDSMKVNLLLMMTFQTINGQQGGSQTSKFEEQSRSIQLLANQSNACVQRLQRLEEDMAIAGDVDDDDEKGSEMSIKTFETADSVRSVRDSIISLYDGTPYERHIGSTSQASFLTAHESPNTHTIVSELVEDYLSGASSLPHGVEDIQKENMDNLTAVSKAISQGCIQSVLTLDGGGVRTYSSLLILRNLMAEIAFAEYHLADAVLHSDPQPLGVPGDWFPRAYKTESSLNYHPCHYFDYIAGASTGGLAAIMLGRLRMSIKDCLRDFLELLKSMFEAPRATSIKSSLNWRQPKYDHQAFEEKFKLMVELRDSKFQERYIDGSFGSNPFQVKTIAVASLRGVSPAHSVPYLFRSYDQNLARSENNYLNTPTGNPPTWQVARALVAAPRYFSPIEIGNREFSGSAKELRNPSLPVFHEVMRMVAKRPDTYTLFISIGSGSFSGPKLDIKGPSPKIGFTEDTMRSNVKQRGKSYTYHRLNPGNRLNNIKYDEWKKTKGVLGNATIDQILQETEMYLADPSVREALRAIAMSLVQKRRARSERKNNERYNTLRDV